MSLFCKIKTWKFGKIFLKRSDLTFLQLMYFRSTVHALYRSSFDDFSSVIGRFQVHSRRDEFPQWRRVTWSMEADLLACSDSLGNVTVLDALCSPICFIPNEVSPASLSNFLLRFRVVRLSALKCMFRMRKSTQRKLKT